MHWYRLGPHMAGRRQQPGIGCDPEPGDAVVPAIADIEKPGRRGQVNLRARVTGVEAGRQGRDRLQRRQRAAIWVDPIRRDAAALFVRKIDKVEAWVKTVVPWPDEV